MRTDLLRQITATTGTPTKSKQCLACGALALEGESECAGCGSSKLVRFSEQGGRDE